MPDPLFTIGHSNHPWHEFQSLLLQHSVKILADVRSSPYSGYNPQYNRETLARTLAETGIEYAFLGEQFGARRTESECYEKGQVRFELVHRTSAFRDGLLRLDDLRREGVVSLMCAERDPLECHRSGMICRRLSQEISEIQHIRADGSLESQDQMETRLLRNAGLPDRDLFRTRDVLLDDAYRWLEQRIAYSGQPTL